MTSENEAKNLLSSFSTGSVAIKIIDVMTL